MDIERRKNESLMSRNTELTRRLEAVKNEKGKAEKELEAANSSIAQKEYRIFELEKSTVDDTEMRKKLDEHSRLNDRLRKKCTKGKTDLEEITGRLEQMETELTEAKNEVNEKDSDLNIAQSELKETSDKLKDTTDKLEQMETELTEAKNDYNEKDSDLNIAQSELKETSDKLKDTSDKLEQTKETLNKSNSHLKDIKSQLAEVEGKENNMKKEIAIIKSRFAEEQNSTREKLLSESTRKANEDKRKIEMLEKQLEEQHSFIRKSENEKNELVITANRERDSAKMDKMNECKKFQSDKAALVADIEDLKSKLTQSESEVTDLRKSLIAANEDLDKKNSELKETEQMKKDYASANTKLNVVEEEKKKLSDQMNDLCCRLTSCHISFSERDASLEQVMQILRTEYEELLTDQNEGVRGIARLTMTVVDMAADLMEARSIAQQACSDTENCLQEKEKELIETQEEMNRRQNKFDNYFEQDILTPFERCMEDCKRVKQEQEIETATIKSRYDQLAADLAKSRKHYNEMVQSKDNRCELMSKENGQLSVEIDKLRNKISEQTSEINELKNELNIKTDEINALRTGNQQLEQENIRINSNYDSRVRELEAKLVHQTTRASLAMQSEEPAVQPLFSSNSVPPRNIPTPAYGTPYDVGPVAYYTPNQSIYHPMALGQPISSCQLPTVQSQSVAQLVTQMPPPFATANQMPPPYGGRYPLVQERQMMGRLNQNQMRHLYPNTSVSGYLPQTQVQQPMQTAIQQPNTNYQG